MDIKIIPMSRSEKFFVAAGRDPRGLPVVAGDGKIVGMVNDMWVDEPEQLVVILNWNWITLSNGTRLVPMTMARIHSIAWLLSRFLQSILMMSCIALKTKSPCSKRKRSHLLRRWDALCLSGATKPQL